MPVIDAHAEYFKLVREFTLAEEWQKSFMLKGSLLTAANNITPPSAQQRLRRFWEEQARKHGVKVDELKTWA